MTRGKLHKAKSDPGPGLTLGNAQLELFPTPPTPPTASARAAAPTSPSSNPLPHPAPDTAASLEHKAHKAISDHYVLNTLLELCEPVRAGGKAAAWLKARRIFKKTWGAQGLRVVDHYHRISESLLEIFTLPRLQAVGLFNQDGHFRFYRHTVLVPWFDHGQIVYLEAYAADDDAVPPVLTIAGPIPCPYNAALLDGTVGRLYLGAGSLDTLELLEAGFPAVGLPMFTEKGEVPHHSSILKSEWMSRFHNKSMYLAFDGDANGVADAARVIAALTAAGVEAHRVEVPVGKRVGAWIAGR